MTTRPWYAHFYGKDYLRVYEATIPPERTRAEVKSVVQLLGLPLGAKILDLCCGYGRHSIELARLGFQVTGFDLSTVLLERARVSSQHAGVDVRWIHGDMRQLPFNKEFDAVINLFTSFGYFESDEEDQGVLDQVYRALNPRGLFLQEIANSHAFLRTYQPTRATRLPDGLFAIDEREFDVVGNHLYVTFTLLHPDGHRNAYDYRLRFYSPAEITKMLRMSGFEVEKYWGGLDGAVLDLDSGFVVTLNRKVENRSSV